ncbi:hypothetical protein ACFOEQ_08300 [Chryseobacterium arachidis]|uniref:hypothetical protein n=1 Tax=Chryseobacterium arachidis TaxID=1416778 RepID=UPI00361B8A89
MKFLIVFFTVFCKIATAQFLTVDNLQHLTAGSVQNLDVKLAEHFKLERNPDMEDDDNRVYSAGHHHTDNFKVLTVFTRAKKKIV